MSESEKAGLARREFLKRAAITGAAVAWATPIVQTVGARPALAATPAPCYFLKITNNGLSETGCDDAVPNGLCFSPAPGFQDGCAGHNYTLSNPSSGVLRVTLTGAFVDCTINNAAVKCGPDWFCSGGAVTIHNSPNSHYADFDCSQGNGLGFSNVALYLCC